MAIAFGDVANAAYTSAATVATGSITVTGSDTLGLVFVHDQAAGSTITAITWNSVAMTLVASVAEVSQGKDYLYAIVGPTTGAVSVTRGTNSNFMSIDAVYYTGVNQSTTLDNFKTSNGTGGATVTTDITPVASNCWAISDFHNDSGNVSVNSGGTLRGAVQGTVSGVADSNATVTAGSPYNIVWNSFNNAGVNWSWITCSIAPVAVAATNRPFFTTLLGVS